MNKEECFVQNSLFEEVLAFIQFDHESKIAIVNSKLVDGKKMLRGDDADSNAIENVTEFSSYGIGQLIGFAVDLGARIVRVKLCNGHANDKGLGIFASLGASFDDKDGVGFVPSASTLSKVDGIDFSLMFPRLQGAKIEFSAEDISAEDNGEKGTELDINFLTDVFEQKINAKDVLNYLC